MRLAGAGNARAVGFARLPYEGHFMRSYAIFMVLLLVSHVAFASATKEPHGKNCRIAKPPAGAETTAVRGMTFFTYPPRPLAENYSGCQSVWLEDKRKLSVAYFESGDVTWVRVREPKNKPYECFYAKGVLKERSSPRCPLAKGWR